MERLQKIIAQAGICSRRKAEELITQGRVSVNGKVITELGFKADIISACVLAQTTAFAFLFKTFGL